MKTPHHLVATSILAFSIVSTASVQAGDYLYETSNGTITITEYTGSGGNVSIPSEIEGLPVTSIGDRAFYVNSSLISIIMPNSVTSIGADAFFGCHNLASAIIGNSVSSIGEYAFRSCSSLSSIIIPNSVTNIGDYAFSYCTSLSEVIIADGLMCIGVGAFQSSGITNIRIPSTVTIADGYFDLHFGPQGAFKGCASLANVIICEGVRIGTYAFADCTNLTGVYFEGNAPAVGSAVVHNATNIAIYYLPGTTGWGTSFGDRPTAPWVLPYPVILTTSPNFGIQTNQFGFRISWATNASVVVEAAPTLANPLWSPVKTNGLVNGWSEFRDAEWTNYTIRFYRIRQW
ncbi:MAG TPA: leucine-rich repeat domain-containing protein [Verrucomicrobiae bacterium]